MFGLDRDSGERYDGILLSKSRFSTSEGSIHVPGA